MKHWRVYFFKDNHQVEKKKPNSNKLFVNIKPKIESKNKHHKTKLVHVPKIVVLKNRFEVFQDRSKHEIDDIILGHKRKSKQSDYKQSFKSNKSHKMSALFFSNHTPQTENYKISREEKKKCKSCGFKKHCLLNAPYCNAFGKFCNYCGKQNHFPQSPNCK